MRFALAVAAGFVLGAAAVFVPASPVVSAQTDLDAFMQQALERRDDNWKKLQQYILDEREQVELRSPAHPALWGERRDYTWFIRDGYFVRSPLKVNGADVGENDRRKYEADFLKRVQRRDNRDQQRQTPPEAADAQPHDIDALIRQTRQPQFISSAYFLRFKFEEGHYALVGHETLDGRDVLRVEYYPARLFSDGRGRRRDQARRNSATDAEVTRLINKGSRVTLWIEPQSHQILQYTFDNVALDFFPAQWLASITGLHASMTMGQPFPDVWLPRGLDVQLGMMLAVGAFDFHYTLDYHDYRRAEITTDIRVPGAR
jgi:hypothetical protein